MSTDPKPPSAAKKAHLGQIFRQFLGGGKGRASAGILTIARGLLSPDAPTRRMSVLFFLSLGMALFSVIWGVERYREHLAHREHVVSQSERDAQHLGDFVAKQAEENKHKASQVGVGTFQIEILPLPGQRKVPGVINMADVDVTLQCDEKDTRDWVDAHSVEARNQIASALLPVQRADLMSHDGKARLKKAIIERLNAWLPKGKVIDVYFTRLIAT